MNLRTLTPPAAPADREPWELTPDTARTMVTPKCTADKPSTWPTHTDVCCWHCCHPFEGPPVPLPTSYDSRLDAFGVVGTFCSFSCAKAYNYDSNKTHVATMHLITLLRKRATGVVGGIVPAPPRRMLQMFGGPMSIEEFRAASLADNAARMDFSNVTMNMPMAISTLQLQEHEANEMVATALTDQPDAIFSERTRPRKKSESTGAPAFVPEQLRLKRAAVLPSQSTLDAFLKK